jgi:hypothetical protein
VQHMSRSIDRESRGEHITDRRPATTHCIVATRPLAACSVLGVAWSATMMPTGGCLDRNRRTQSWHQCRRIRIVRHSGSHRDVIRLAGTGNGSFALDVDRTDFGASVDRRASISVSRFPASVGRSRAPMRLRARRGGVVLPPQFTSWKGFAWPQ